MRLQATQLDWISAPSESRQSYPRQARSVMPAPSDSVPGRGRTTWQARRDDGMARAQDHAEEDMPGWTEAAAEFLRDYAQTVAGPFLVEQARAASRHRVPKPANGKAWGPAAVMAVKRGWIVKAGFGPASSSNGSPKTLFRAGAA